jgi:hypothetical protein
LCKIGKETEKERRRRERIEPGELEFSLCAIKGGI